MALAARTPSGAFAVIMGIHGVRELGARLAASRVSLLLFSHEAAPSSIALL